MNIPRDILMKIIGGLPDDKLIQALSVIGGAGAGGQDGSFDAMSAMGISGDDSNHIQPWQDRTVDYGGAQNRPTLTDKTWAQQPVNAQQPVSGEPMPEDEGNPFLQAGGT